MNSSTHDNVFPSARLRTTLNHYTVLKIFYKAFAVYYNQEANCSLDVVEAN